MSAERDRCGAACAWSEIRDSTIVTSVLELLITNYELRFHGSQQLRLHAARQFQPKLAIGICGSHPTLSRAFNVTLHDQIGLVHFFDGAGLFANCDRE